MTRGQLNVLIFYLVGYAQVLGWIAAVSVICMWALQMLALSFGMFPDGGAILVHLILTLTFLAFYPGQTVVIHMRKGPDGRVHVIVGSDRHRSDGA